MDHSLRTISYIADIGEILVIMARRRLIGSPGDTDSIRCRKQAKIICHVFESDEVIFSSHSRCFPMKLMSPVFRAMFRNEQPKLKVTLHEEKSKINPFTCNRQLKIHSTQTPKFGMLN